MAVNNDMDISPESIKNKFADALEPLEIPESLLSDSKLTLDQKKLIKALLKNPNGLLCSELTQEGIAVSNNDLIHFRLQGLLASHGLRIVITPVSRHTYGR